MSGLADTAMVKKMGGGAQTAEEHRDAREHSGFIGSIGDGKVDFSRIPSPWPQTPQDEAAKLTDYLARLKEFCAKIPRPIREGRVDMPLTLIEKMGEFGLFALKVPAEWGGSGFSHSSYIAILAFLTTHYPAALIMLSAHNTIGGLYPTLYYGNEEQKKEWMPILTKWPSAFCFTEDKVGSDPARMESFAQPVYGPAGETIGYTITGTKYYATNSAYADGVPLAKLLAVIVRLVNDPEKEIARWSRLEPLARRKAKKEESKKISAEAGGDKAKYKELEYNAGLKARYGCFILPTDIPGFKVVQRTEFEGMSGIFNGILRFENVFAKPHNKINGDGFKIALESLTNGRLAIGESCIAAAKRDVLGMTWYASRREQWEQLIIDKELIGAGMISPAIADIFACEALSHYTAHRADNKQDIRLEATLVKVAASKAQHRIVRDLNTLVGGRAYEKFESLSRREECVPAFLWMRNSWPCETFEGSTQILTLWSERELDNDFIMSGLAFKTGGLWAKLKVSVSMMKQFIMHGLSAATTTSGDHNKFIAKTAHRLRRVKIMLYGIHKESLLERKQMMCRRLVNIVVDLALMAMAVRYADSLDRGGSTYQELADFFCKEARLRISENFRAIKRNNDELAWKVLSQHRAGKYDEVLTKNLAPADWLLVKHAPAEEQAAELTAAKAFDPSVLAGMVAKNESH
jgi:alkylation response protein AidB-like acyl-CoA dehydrogenase